MPTHHDSRVSPGGNTPPSDSSPDFFRKLVEHSSSMYVVLNPDGAVRYVSPAVQELLGFVPGEHLGQNIVHPDDVPLVKQAFHNLLQTPNANAIVQVRFRTKTGNWSTFQGRAFNYVNDPLIGGVLVEGLDLTHTKQLETFLSQAESQLSAIIATATDAIITLDSEQRVVLFNHAAEEMFGYAAPDVLGASLDRFIPPRFRQAHHAHLQSFVERQDSERRVGQDLKLYGLRANGEEFPVETSISQAHAHGQNFFTVILRDVAEQKRAADALRASQQELEAVYNGMVDGMLIADAQTKKFLRANAAIAQLLGYSQQELQVMSVAEIHSPEALPHVMQQFEQIAAGKLKVAENIPCLRRDGSVFYADITASLVTYHDTFCIIGFFRDVTPRRRAQQRLEIQYAVMQILTEAETLTQASPKILQAICARLSWQIGELWTVDAEKQVLRCVEAWHPPTADGAEFKQFSCRQTFRPSVGLPGRVWASGEPQWVADVGEDSGFARRVLAARAGLHGAFGFPIVSGSEVLGVMTFFSHQVEPPDDELLKVMATIGGQIGQFMQRKRAEEALRQSETRFRAVIEGLDEGLLITDLENTVLYANSRLAEMTGYTVQELVGKPAYGSLLAPTQWPDLLRRTQLRQRGISERYQLELFHKSGTAFWTEISSTPYRSPDGAVIGTISAITDITTRKRAEVLAAKLSRAVEQTADKVMITDRDGAIEYVNAAFEQFTGYSKAAVLGQTPRLLKSSKHDLEFYRALWATILSGQVFHGVIVNRKKDGELYYEENTITPLKDQDGKITHFVSTGKDITGRMRIEEENQRKTRHLMALSQMGQTVLASLDLDTVLREVIDQMLPLLGGAEGISILLAERDELVFAAVGGAGSESLRNLRLPANAGVAGQVLRTGQAVRVSGANERVPIYREIESITGYYTKSLLAAPLKLGNTIIGVMEAVHRQPNAFLEDDLHLLRTAASWAAIAIGNARLFKQIERAKKEWEQTFDALDEGIALVDDRCQILRVNRSLAHRLQTSPAALVGRFCYQVIQNQAAPPPHCPAARGAAPDQPRVQELDLPHLNGTFQLTSYPLRDPEGTFGGAVNVLKDVTREKRLQAQLIQAEKMAATGRLAASIAHEINNPLQAIQGCLEMTETHAGDVEKQHHYNAMARDELERLALIVRRMLDFYRPAKGTPTAVDVRVLVEDVLALCGKQMQHAQVRAQTAWSTRATIVNAVGNQLKQVFFNLILNAVEAMPHGGALQISGQTRYEHGVWLTVAFADTGVGIAAQDLAQVLEPFFTSKPGGTGLGLAVSNNIIVQHGGRITVESEVGKGAQFTIWLPLSE